MFCRYLFVTHKTLNIGNNGNEYAANTQKTITFNLIFDSLQKGTFYALLEYKI